MIASVLPTENVATESLLQLCDHRVSKVVTQDNLRQCGISRKELIQRIAKIVSCNLAFGRAQQVLEAWERRSRGEEETRGQGDKGIRRREEGGRGKEVTLSPPLLVIPSPWHPGTPAQIEAYVDRVIGSYLQEHSRVERLAAGDDAQWTRLLEQLTSRAYNMLLRLQVPPARAVNEASDFAQQTCENIFRHRFPYDVSFDAWVTLILKNQILQRYTRSPDLMDRQTEIRSLDRPGPSEAEGNFALYDLLVDQSSTSAFECTQTQDWLIQAIAHLPSRAQQQVIIDTFFHELSDEEIARHLDKTRQAVYNLRHRALQRLNQILER